jgi:hypothetical protein
MNLPGLADYVIFCVPQKMSFKADDSLPKD